MTLQESAQLANDPNLRGRVKMAAVKYADSILNEPSSTAGHQGRTRWANSTNQQPDLIAGQLQPLVVMDGAVQSAGAAVTDDALQSAVEAVVNKSL